MKQHMTGERPQHHGWSIQRMLDACEPMKTVSVEVEPLLSKTASLRKPGESVLAFIGRTGLSPRQITEWKLGRLMEWCEAAERRNADMESEPKLKGGF